MAKFVSKTHACLSVVLDSGKSMHVSFTEVTGGSSVLYTNDEAVIKGLRRHPRYGKLFKEEKETPVAKVPVAEVKPKSAEKEAIPFATLEDAKDYFSERYGVSRSKMRTMAAVEDVAKSHGINITWN